MAVDVRLRGGMRSARHHRQVGTLLGAHDAEAGAVAGFSRRHPEYGSDLGLHPLQVVSAWAQQLAVGDLDETLALYRPDAVVHLRDVALVSPRHIRHCLETLPVFSTGRLPAIRGEDGLVVAHWDAPTVQDQALEARCQVRRGLITEQWIGPPPDQVGPSALATGSGPVALTTTSRGAVPAEALDYAVQRVQEVAARVHEPILSARIKLSAAADPARSRPCLAQASLDVNGQVVRAHIAARQMREAVDLMAQRLADRLEHRAQRIEALRRHSPGQAEPGEWRHGDLAAGRPEYFDRPPEERQLVRHKAFFPVEQSVEEAIFDLGLLDYDFYLFRDLASGQDSLVERLPGGIHRLQHLHPTNQEAAASTYKVETDPVPAPTLAIQQATERLTSTGARFVFFASPRTGRGCVIYRRYDGHYGLITLE
jgi:hypothetical protein